MLVIGFVYVGGRPCRTTAGRLIGVQAVKSVPHIAFVVDDLQAAIAGKEILIEPNSPTDGVTVAFIVDNGAPIEFLQFDRPEDEVWPHEAKYRPG